MHKIEYLVSSGGWVGVTAVSHSMFGKMIVFFLFFVFFFKRKAALFGQEWARTILFPFIFVLLLSSANINPVTSSLFVSLFCLAPHQPSLSRVFSFLPWPTPPSAFAFHPPTSPLSLSPPLPRFRQRVISETANVPVSVSEGDKHRWRESYISLRWLLWRWERTRKGKWEEKKESEKDRLLYLRKYIVL